MVTSNESDFSKMKQNWRRLAFVIAYALYTSAWLCYFRHFWFFESKNDTSSGRVALMWLFRILILLYSPFALQQMIGYFSFFPNWAAYDSEETQKPEEKFPPLVIRVVSRGDDIPVLQRGIECHTAVLERLGVTKFLYQLVVEKPNNLAQGKVEVVLVPQNYATPKKTLYKGEHCFF